jgi:hypothetical protein
MPNLDEFENKLENIVSPNLSAKELAERIVVAVLEAEYGKSFTLSKGFAKMVNTLADSIVTNPDLRRQALAIASQYSKKNNERQKSIEKQSQENNRPRR